MLEPAWQPCDGRERAGQSVLLVFHHILLYNKGIAQAAEYAKGLDCLCFPVLTCARHLPHPLCTLLPGNQPQSVDAIDLRLQQS